MPKPSRNSPAGREGLLLWLQLERIKMSEEINDDDRCISPRAAQTIATGSLTSPPSPTQHPASNHFQTETLPNSDTVLLQQESPASEPACKLHISLVVPQEGSASPARPSAFRATALRFKQVLIFQYLEVQANIYYLRQQRAWQGEFLRLSSVFAIVWYAWRDSNPRPVAPEATALSI
jgi:hypothetical protein